MSGGPQAALLVCLVRARSRSLYGLGFLIGRAVKCRPGLSHRCTTELFQALIPMAPLVTIFNLIKKERNGSASQEHTRVLQ